MGSFDRLVRQSASPLCAALKAKPSSRQTRGQHRYKYDDGHFSSADEKRASAGFEMQSGGASYYARRESHSYGPPESGEAIVGEGDDSGKGIKVSKCNDVVFPRIIANGS